MTNIIQNWSTDPILGSHAFVLLLAGALVLLLLVRPAFRSLSRRRHLILLALRAAVILLVLMAMLRPTHIRSTTKRQTATLLVLFDQSRSMQLPEGSGVATRWQAQRRSLEQASDALSRLATELELKVYGFDSELHPAEFRQGAIAFPDEPLGEQTDLGTCLSEALRRERGKRLAGVLLFSDGTQTVFTPAVEIAQAERQMRDSGDPLYTIAFGPAGDATQARDVAIENMPEQYTVFVKNELLVRGQLRIRGYANKGIPVELLVTHPDGKQDVVGPVTLSVPEDNRQAAVNLSYVPEVPGQYRLTLRAAVQSGEQIVENNELTAFLTVLSGGLKVVYVSGEIRLESRFLRQSLAASPDIELVTVSLDHRQPDQRPVELAELIKDPQVDAFIIGDVDSAALGDQLLADLAAAVERGKGLIMLGGFHSFGAGGYQQSLLSDVLPVVMGRLERQEFNAADRTDLHLKGLRERVRMVPTRPHPVTQLAPGERNDSVWRELPPLDGANRFSSVKQAPGVSVIAATTEGEPLLVTGQYGQGRVLAFAGDSTFRWVMGTRQRDFRSQHRRFWRQVILWLVRREDLNQHDVWVKLPQRRFNPGASVGFSAGASTVTGEPLLDATVRVELLAPDGQRKEIRLVRDGDHYAGSVDRIASPGDYTIEVNATRGEESLGNARADFQVLDLDVELSNPAADHNQLVRLAQATEQAGGRHLTPDELPTLLQGIELPDLEIDVQSKWQLADTWWDASLLLLAFVSLLTGEWFLRKKWGLI